MTQDIQDQVLLDKFLPTNLEPVEQEAVELVELEHQPTKELPHYQAVELIRQDIKLEETCRLEQHPEWDQHLINQLLIKAEVAYKPQEQDIKAMELVLELAMELVLELAMELVLDQAPERDQALLVINQQQHTEQEHTLVRQVDRQAKQEVRQEVRQAKVVTQQAKEETNQDQEVLIMVVHIAQQINDWIREILLN